jgi:hypothetical protein
VQRFIAVYLSLVTQSVACNRLHNTEERYSRGRMAILNRRGLEDASCECYAVGARQIEQLLRPGR